MHSKRTPWIATGDVVRYAEAIAYIGVGGRENTKCAANGKVFLHRNRIQHSRAEGWRIQVAVRPYTRQTVALSQAVDDITPVKQFFKRPGSLPQHLRRRFVLVTIGKLNGQGIQTPAHQIRPTEKISGHAKQKRRPDKCARTATGGYHVDSVPAGIGRPEEGSPPDGEQRNR